MADVPAAGARIPRARDAAREMQSLWREQTMQRAAAPTAERSVHARRRRLHDGRAAKRRQSTALADSRARWPRGGSRRGARDGYGGSCC